MGFFAVGFFCVGGYCFMLGFVCGFGGVLLVLFGLLGFLLFHVDCSCFRMKVS